LGRFPISISISISIQKLIEEVQEFNESETAEELADILEVVHALAKQINTDLSELEKLQKSKHQERGGFEKRLFLEQVTSSQ
jgi:predicted house-cleaning noncanonical NTP pyrophosphatase (MazG superfamily)